MLTTQKLTKNYIIPSLGPVLGFCPIVSQAQGEMITNLFGTAFTDFLRKTEFVPTQHAGNINGWQWLNSSNRITVQVS